MPGTWYDSVPALHQAPDTLSMLKTWESAARATKNIDYALYEEHSLRVVTARTGERLGHISAPPSPDKSRRYPVLAFTNCMWVDNLA